jgi:hypothetical protein
LIERFVQGTDSAMLHERRTGVFGKFVFAGHISLAWQGALVAATREAYKSRATGIPR